MTAPNNSVLGGESKGPAQILWTNPRPESTRVHTFKELISKKYNLPLKTYDDLYQWSLDSTSDFWEEVWHFTAIRSSKTFSKAFDEAAPMFPRPTFFEGAKLNFAENLLYPACQPDENSTAIIAATETSREHVTWKELRERARKCATALLSMGVQVGDKVAGYLGNHTNTVVAMLGTTSIGAIWTGISPDTGVHAVLDRLMQIEPTILFADNAVVYNGRIHDTHDKVAQVSKQLSTLKGLVMFESVRDHPFDLSDISVAQGKAWKYKDLVTAYDPQSHPGFAQLPADHPVYILYSSGTTGTPKCIIHGSIGTLIQHKKEHEIQCDIRPGERIFYFTTCTWMMWHWLVSALASGATLVLYDGSPFRPLDGSGHGEMAMPRLIEELDVAHFGTSAKYLSLLEQKDIMPKKEVPMKTLRAIYSTGSPLAPSTFDYVYRAFGPKILLGSITGGTDIISLFGAPSPISPVYQGEIMVRGLGMAVEVWDLNGQNVTHKGEPGELVCVKSFPCQPVAFWGRDGVERYRKSYFEKFPGIWHHGDYIQINPRTGGLWMLGRSDGVLKPSGVRFGSSEIYNVLLKYFPNIEDALCIGRRRETDTDETVVLFLKMMNGYEISDDLVDSIKGRIRKELSARHVPGIIDQCPEIPVTTNGKKVENAVKHILSGMDIKMSASVANVDSLNFYREWAEVHN
ncbi:MAG: hypothetical protein M1834_005484 [Cirrosporium novae-zelandiae]|nr:MAG: hypothetical protein M1834_005484 [Cirrosporium novae-zelandiae]